eukprot:6111001-Pleurochrysis_carterae.AAC.1
MSMQDGFTRPNNRSFQLLRRAEHHVLGCIRTRVFYASFFLVPRPRDWLPLAFGQVPDIQKLAGAHFVLSQPEEFYDAFSLYMTLLVLPVFPGWSDTSLGVQPFGTR